MENVFHKFQKIKKLYDFNPKYSNSESKNIDSPLISEGSIFRKSKAYSILSFSIIVQIQNILIPNPKISMLPWFPKDPSLEKSEAYYSIWSFSFQKIKNCRNAISNRRRARYSLYTDGLFGQTSPRDRESGNREIFPSDRFHRPIVLRLQNARKRLALQASARDYRTSPVSGAQFPRDANW